MQISGRYIVWLVRKRKTNQIGYIILTMGPAVVVVTSIAGVLLVVVTIVDGAVVVVAKDEVVDQSLTSDDNCSSCLLDTCKLLLPRICIYTTTRCSLGNFTVFDTHAIV